METAICCTCPWDFRNRSRVQGCFVSDKEVERVVEFIKQTFQAEYDELVMEEVERQTEMVASAQDGKSSGNSDSGDIDTSDERLEEAIDFVVESGTCSTSSLQRSAQAGLWKSRAACRYNGRNGNSRTSRGQQAPSGSDDKTGMG